MFNTIQNKTKLTDRVNSLMLQSKVSKRDMEKLIGHLNFVCKYMVDAKVQLHNLLSFLYSINRVDRDKKVEFPEDVKAGLNYWLNDDNYTPVSIESRQADLTVYSDASKGAWSGLIAKDCHSQALSGNWSAEVRQMHINLKELKAVFECLSCFSLQVRNVNIDWFLDNTSALSWLRK